jgi:predicted nucleotidyltransferase
VVPIARFAVDIAWNPSDTVAMPAEAPPLLPVFRSRLQGELLALTLPDPDREWTIDELAERTGEPYQTVATEIRRLQEADLLTAETVGRTKLLQANLENPYLRPLTQLATMAFGPPMVVAEEFGQVDGIDAIYIYGSWAARYEGESGPSPQDIDVLVLGKPDRDDVFDAAQRAQRRLGREVNVTQRTRRQWETATDGFTEQVRSSPMVEIPYRPTDGEVEQGE